MRGAAQTVADSRQAEAATGRSDQDWWPDRAALLAEVDPDFSERFPYVSRLESESTPEPFADDGGAVDSDDGEPSVTYLEREARATFAVGLGVLLDGTAAAVTARAGKPDRD